MKLNYKKINPWFFLVGVVICFAFCALNASLFENSKGVFLIMIITSLAICTFCFYKLNNGLIALLRGRFAMPSKKDNNFVDYSKPRVENAQEIKQAVSYSEKCLIMYKLNSREVLQIYRKGDRLVVHKCFPEKEKSELICDFENAVMSKNDWFIPISEIKSITFGISKTNYDLPIFSINRNNKTYRFIGYFEPVTKELLSEFFADICKVRTRNGEGTAKVNSEKAEKTKFLYNILELLTALTVPAMILVFFVGETSILRLLGSIYMIVTLILLAVSLVVVIKNKNKLIFDYNDETGKRDSQRELLLEFLVLNAALYLPCFAHTVYLNVIYFAVLCTVLFAILTYFYFKGNPFKKPGKNAEKSTTLERKLFVLLTVLFIGFSSANLVAGANYVIPVRTTTEQYAILDTEKDAEDNDLYTVTIRVESKEKTVSVSKERLSKNASFLKATKTKGILGIEYINKEPL